MAPLVLITAWIVFFARQLFFGEVFYCCDNLLVNIPSKVFLIEELGHGRFPLWNPYLFSGTPFLADINLSVLHPINLLYAVYPPFQALTLGVGLLFLVAILGMYLLLRLYRSSKEASIAGALVFGLGGSLVVYTNNIPILQVAALLPWVVVSWHRFFDKPTRGRLVALVLALTFQIISGHPQITYYTWMFLLFYTFFAHRNGFVVSFCYVVLIAVLVFMVGSVQILPFAEFAYHSTRVRQGFEFVTQDSVHPLSLARLILPNIVGNAAAGTAWVAMGTVLGYVGILPIVVALLPRRKGRIVRFYSVVAVVCLLLSFGKYTPLYAIAYRLLPGFGLFREPGHFLFFYSFALAAITGLSLDTLVQKGFGKRMRVIVSLVSGLAVLGGIAGIAKSSLIVGFISNVSAGFPERLQRKLSALPVSTLQAISTMVSQNLFIVGLLLGATLLILRTKILDDRAKRILLGVLMFVDVFLFSRHNLLTAPYPLVTSWEEEGAATASLLGGAQWSRDRLLVDPKLYPAPRTKQFGLNNEWEESLWQYTILRPSLGMPHLAAIDGYASMVYRPYQEYFSLPATDPTGIALPPLGNPSLDSVGMRYILTNAASTTMRDNAKFRFIGGNERLALYENTRALPRTFFFSDDKTVTRGLTVLTNTPNAFLVATEASAPATLVWSSVGYPGWRAYVDGREERIIPYKGVLQSVGISQGSHTVSFRFLPKSLAIGLSFTSLGFVIVVFFGISALRDKKR